MISTIIITYLLSIIFVCGIEVGEEKNAGELKDIFLGLTFKDGISGFLSSLVVIIIIPLIAVFLIGCSVGFKQRQANDQENLLRENNELLSKIVGRGNFEKTPEQLDLETKELINAVIKELIKKYYA